MCPLLFITTEPNLTYLLTVPNQTPTSSCVSYTGRFTTLLCTDLWLLTHIIVYMRKMQTVETGSKGELLSNSLNSPYDILGPHVSRPPPPYLQQTTVQLLKLSKSLLPLPPSYASRASGRCIRPLKDSYKVSEMWPDSFRTFLTKLKNYAKVLKVYWVQIISVCAVQLPSSHRNSIIVTPHHITTHTRSSFLEYLPIYTLTPYPLHHNMRARCNPPPLLPVWKHTSFFPPSIHSPPSFIP